MAQRVGDRHHGHRRVFLAGHLETVGNDLFGDERPHAVMEAYNPLFVVGDERQTVFRTLETGLPAVGDAVRNVEMVFRAQRFPRFLLVLRQDDDDAELGVIMMEPLYGVHEHGLASGL